MTKEEKCSLKKLQEIIDQEKDILVFFTLGGQADCPACEYYANLTSALAAEDSRFKYGQVSIDPDDASCKEIAEKLDLQEWPTVIGYKGGREIKRLSPKLDMEKDIDELCNLADSVFGSRNEATPSSNSEAPR